MTRLAPIVLETMNPAQRRVHDAALAGRRGYLPAPLQAWLRSPEMAMHAQQLGESIRFDLSLPPAVTAVAALAVASHWQAGYVQAVQATKLREAGVEDAAIDAIKAGRQPALADRAQATAYQTARRLLRAEGLDDAAYAEAAAVLGEAGLVELVAAIGYYTLVSMTAVAFSVPAEPGT